MTRRFSILLAAALLATAPIISPAFAAPETYELDPAHTNLTWQANHLGFSNPSGKFTDVKGILVLDEADPEKSRLDVTIRTESVLTGIEKFDDHLRSKDFFNVEKYPTARFKSRRVERTGKNTAQVIGELTLLGVTRPVLMDVTLNKIGLNPMSKVKTAGFSAKTMIVRSEHGMTYGLPGVSDEVNLMIEAEATKVKDKRRKSLR